MNANVYMCTIIVTVCGELVYVYSNRQNMYVRRGIYTVINSQDE